MSQRGGVEIKLKSNEGWASRGIWFLIVIAALSKVPSCHQQSSWHTSGPYGMHANTHSGTHTLNHRLIYKETYVHTWTFGGSSKGTINVSVWTLNPEALNWGRMFVLDLLDWPSSSNRLLVTERKLPSLTGFYPQSFVNLLKVCCRWFDLLDYSVDSAGQIR